MLQGWEWIAIGAVIIVIILWGPSKIPELARALGKAKGDFKASKESNVTAQAVTVASPLTIQSNGDVLLATAQRLGISTDGKTRQMISEEVSRKVKVLGAQ